MHVWDRVTREQAQRDPEGKIVGTRCVFAKEGDKVRCRLVAQELAGRDEGRPLRWNSTLISYTLPPLRQRVSKRKESAEPTSHGNSFQRGISPRAVHEEHLHRAPCRGVPGGDMRASLCAPCVELGTNHQRGTTISEERHDRIRVWRVQCHYWSVHTPKIIMIGFVAKCYGHTS